MKILNRLPIIVLIVTAACCFTASAQIADCPKTDYTCQIAAYTKQIAADPNNVEAYYNRGRAFHYAENYAQAITDLTRYISLNTSNKEYLSDGYIERGLCYKSKGDYESAVADFNQAIKLVPGDSRAYYNRGNTYSAKESWDLAIASFTSALSIKPDDSAALAARGHAYMGKKDYASAFADFTHAIQVNPEEAEPYYNRAIIESSRKEYSKAVADYDKYISINTNNIPYLADGYLNRGLVYVQLDNLPLAVKDFAAAIDLRPDDPKPYRARASVYRAQGKTDLAAADEQKAASLTP